MKHYNQSLEEENTFQPIKKKSARKPLGKRRLDELMEIVPESQAGSEQQTQFTDPDLEQFFQDGILETLLYRLKSGKEATVYVGEGPQGLVAIKIYSDMKARSFKNEAVYREGRFIGSARIERAINQGTEKGLNFRQILWVGEEFVRLKELHLAGVRVPCPLGHAGRSIAMQFIGDHNGAAPRISELDLSYNEAAEAFRQSVHNMGLMLKKGRVHCDYSAYNILWWKKSAYVIDLPQMIETMHNPNAYQMLCRDASTLCRTFRRFGIKTDPEQLVRTLMEEYYHL